MKVLIITGSRADWNGLGMVARALLAREHDVRVVVLSDGVPDRARVEAITEDVGAERRSFHQIDGVSFGDRAGWALRFAEGAAESFKPGLVLLAGDRWEIAASALACSIARVPIVHIGGGDQTEGSADDRYRDAITALASVHCATNVNAYLRLSRRVGTKDLLALTGSPAIDRIKATAPQAQQRRVVNGSSRNVLVQVHPNTVGSDATVDVVHTMAALVALRGPRSCAGESAINLIALGAADDPGKDQVDKLLRAVADTFLENLAPAEYYWLLGAVDVLVGNSSAALYEAPCFGLPAVLVGDRQKGRILPSNVIEAPADATKIAEAVKAAFTLEGPFDNPYDRGINASAHIVQTMESFIGASRPVTSELSNVKQNEEAATA